MRRWFRANRPSPRPRFAELQAMPPAERARALAGPAASEWIEAAANHGLVEAQLLHGQALLGTDPALAFRWFAGAAAAGHAPAINMLGRCLEKGWGTPIDLVAAAARYRDAAVLGHDWAQFNLANLLLHGLGLARDRAGAFAWYGRAAAQGHAKSMNMLGRFHEEGWDGTRDPGAALGWYARAAAAGDYRAQFNLATILAQAGRREEAAPWVRAALAAGDPDFQNEAQAAMRRAGWTPDR